MSEILNGTTNLDHVLSSVNDLPEIGRGNYRWSDKVIPAWQNDVTQLNEDNLNALSEGITNLRTVLMNFGDGSKLALEHIVNNGAGWKSNYSTTSEVFNDYKNNLALSDYSHSEGGSTTSGGVGYQVRVIDQCKGHIWLTKKHSILEVTDKNSEYTEDVSEEDFLCSYVVDENPSNNQFYCIVAGGNYSKLLQGKIIAVNGNRITYDLKTANVIPTFEDTEYNKRIIKAVLYVPGNRTPSGDTVSTGQYSHAEGYQTHSIGVSSHTEGDHTHAFGPQSHAEGQYTFAVGVGSHSEGGGTWSLGRFSHAEGQYTVAVNNQHVQGKYNEIDEDNLYSHIIGNGSSESNRKNIHTVTWGGEGWYLGSVLSDADIVAYNKDTKKRTSLSQLRLELIDEISNRDSGDKTLLGEVTDTSDDITIYGIKAYTTESLNNLKASYIYTSAGDQLSTLHDIITWVGLTGEYKSFNDILSEKLMPKLDSQLAVGTKFTEGDSDGTGEVFNDYERNIASGKFSHAEGTDTLTTGIGSHAEGFGTASYAKGSHAEGEMSKSTARCSHSEGYNTYSDSLASHSEGLLTVARSDGQHVQGRANILDTSNRYAHIIGNGIVKYDENTDSYSIESNSNAHTVDWDGNAWYAGNIFLGGNSQDSARRLPMIYSGDSAPNDSVGQDGDIYIMYDPVVETGE